MSGFKGVAAGRDGPVHRAANDPPGASWNYRVIEFADLDGSPWFSIHEVHYRNGKPFGYGETSADASSEDLEGIAWVLEKMGEALSRPVLRERDFSGGALIVGPVNPAESGASSPAEGRAGKEALDEPLQERVEELEGALKAAFYTIVGPQTAHRMKANGWQWPDDAPEQVSIVAEKVREILARSALSHKEGEGNV